MIRNQLVAMVMALILSSLVTYPVEAIVTPRNNQIWHQDSMGVAGVAEDEDQFGSGGIAAGDFNGDGRDDLAVGVPYEDLEPVLDAGAVHVFYGSPGGLSAAGNQYWHQNLNDLPGDAGNSDLFGKALAVGDFNHDGYKDLAIGVPGKPFEGIGRTGAVQVLYGSAAGLTAQGNQLFWGYDAGNDFGAALAAGDFDGDGYDDLAIGLPGASNLATANGGVVIRYGSALGLTTPLYGRRLFFAQGWMGDLPDSMEDYDHFGASLAAGDFNGDGYHDLAIGVPDEDVGSWWGDRPDAGVVHVVYGSPTGLIAADSQIYGLDDFLYNNGLGSSLAGADFNGDGWDDLAVGVPWAAYVKIFSGSATGLDLTGPLKPECEPVYILFGFSLTTGHFSSPRFADLAVGSPHWHYRRKDLPYERSRAGSVVVFNGASGGLNSTRAQRWHQESPSILDEAEDEDQFGTSLAAGDFDGNGLSDLAVGVPFEDFKGASGLVISNAGVVQILYSYQFWQPSLPAVLTPLLLDD